MYIHKEGYNTLVGSGVLLGLLNFGIFWFSEKSSLIEEAILVVLCFLLFFFLLRFFRNPQRNILIDNNIVLSPADGKIVAIEEVLEPEYFKDKRIQVSVFMSPFNVHVNRSPISGKIKYCKYFSGKYLMAFNPKSSTLNERTTIVVEQDNNLQVLFRQIAGFLARRIIYYVKEGDTINQGAQFGFIKFGSRVDVFLPCNTKILVRLNQKVTGGLTALGQIT